ncbi:MAG: hypothetical protein COA84_12210 [Robiginitomaculum sp.]|nr:MAG: hypothetical protein COA84_12210 [Robiginitomaculum sp.]
MPQIQVNGISLYYQSAGNGPPLVLIAGFTSDGQSWAPVVAGLSRQFQVITFDNRTTGRTRPAEAKTSMALMADDCVGLMSALEIGHAHILGHSMGGIVAIDIASRYPERIEKLILAATTPDQNSFQLSVLETILSLRQAKGSDQLWLKSFLHWLFHPSFFDDPTAVKTALANAAAYPYRQSMAGMAAQLTVLATMKNHIDIKKVKAKTLVILGSNDLFYPLAEAKRTLSAIPNVDISVIAKAGHSVHWDQPDMFVRLVSDFLKN